MSKKEKLLKKFLEIPHKKDLTFEELETLLGYSKGIDTQIEVTERVRFAKYNS